MNGPGLERSLTWVQGTGMAVGAVLGSGVLILPAITANQSGPASVLAWIGMSALAFPMAFTLGRLGARYPHAGGIIEYVRRAFGPGAGRAAGWLFLGTIPVGVPIVALVGAQYTAAVFRFPAWTIPVMAGSLLAVSLILNIRGVRVAGFAQVAFLSAVALLMISAVAGASLRVDARNFVPFAPHGWAVVGESAVSIFWCFVGWEMVGHLAEEFRDPERDLRMTFVLSPAIVGALYVALSAVTVGAHAYGAPDGLAPLSVLVGLGFGRLGFLATGAIALLVSAVAIHGNVAGFSRMMYAQARKGELPAFMARLNTKHQTPSAALWALGADFAVVLGAEAGFHLNLSTLVKWPSVVFLVLYAAAMAAAVKLLDGGRAARLAAAVPGLVCVFLLPFSGWAILYPALLGGIGWLVSPRAAREAEEVNAEDLKSEDLNVTGEAARGE